MSKEGMREKIISVFTRGFLFPEYREWGESGADAILNLTVNGIKLSALIEMAEKATPSAEATVTTTGTKIHVEGFGQDVDLNG